MKVEKNSFRVLKTKSGTLIVESPLRLDVKGREPKNVLVIDDKVSVMEKAVVFPTSTHEIHSAVQTVGLLGLKCLTAGKYLIVATKRELAATVQLHKIWRITAGECIPVGHQEDIQSAVKSKKLSEKELSKLLLDQTLLKQICSILNSGQLYFSTTYDISHSIQHNQLSSKDGNLVDDRYFFNADMAIPLKNLSDEPWLIKTIVGFAGSVDIEYVKASVSEAESSQITNKLLFTVTLLSRINHRRIGTRYVRRGLDFDGNAANNVEMEQIVFHHDFTKNKAISSFIQMRGSAPAIWGQELDLSYKPKLMIADISKPEIWKAIETHYKDMLSQYQPDTKGKKDNGKIICVNLLDTAKFEGQLTETYEETIKRLKNDKVEYEEFPVHKYCKNMNYRNMDILLDRVRQRLINSGWLVGEGMVPSLDSANTSFRIFKSQTGFARVSCLDSLDRTNLTCALFAKYILAFQVQEVSPNLPAVNVLHSNVVPAVETNDAAFTTRKAIEGQISRITNLWADSGDSISLLYAGTGALKADVTRTGQRLFFKGPFDDGLNSITRYYLNNFADGMKQDSFDIWTGKISLEKLCDYASTKGLKDLERYIHGIADKEKSFIFKLLPDYVTETVEKISQDVEEYKKPHQNSKSHFDPENNPVTFVGLVIKSLQSLAPQRISSFWDLFMALSVFYYIMILVLIFRVDGIMIVNRPRFSTEYESLKYIVGKSEKSAVKDKKKD